MKLLFALSVLVGLVTGKPNILVFMADDLGYGDLDNFPTSEVPNLQKLKRSSRYMSSFYAGNPVCSPSRSTFMTAKYPVRTGIYPFVFFPTSVGGLSHEHKTIATYLKELGYKTAHIGKWHLGVGVNKEYLPTTHGFDEYFGIPYSQDMCPCKVCFPFEEPCIGQCRDGSVGCPLFDNTKIVEQPTNLPTLTERYTRRAVDFINRTLREGENFFLYHAFHHTHFPQFSGLGFRNTSARGAFGDSLAEMDHSIGTMLSFLKLSDQLENTIIFFTSDNGPSLTRHTQGGCAGPLRCGKGTTWEGGIRVPAMISWKGHIHPGVSSALMTMLDVMPTLVGMVEPVAAVGRANATDGVDFTKFFLRKQDSPSPRKAYLIFPQGPNKKVGPLAVRYKNYKAHYFTEGAGLSDDNNYDVACRSSSKLTRRDPPLLFDMDSDPGERWPLDQDSKKYKEIMEVIDRVKKETEMTLQWAESEIDKGDSRSAAPCCTDNNCEPFPECCNCSS